MALRPTRLPLYPVHRQFTEDNGDHLEGRTTPQPSRQNSARNNPVERDKASANAASSTSGNSSTC